MGPVLELDEAMQTIVATLTNIEELMPEQEERIHQLLRHCFLTAEVVWEKANISACTVSGQVGSVAII